MLASASDDVQCVYGGLRKTLQKAVPPFRIATWTDCRHQYRVVRIVVVLRQVKTAPGEAARVVCLDNFSFSNKILSLQFSFSIYSVVK